MSQLLSILREPKVRIYALKDPVTPYRVRYVGKTRKSLSHRLSQHFCDINRRRTPKNHWLKLLRSKGLKPDVQLLELCDDSAWSDREKSWIAFYRAVGPLLNVCDGGDCGPIRKGWKHTAEALKKIGEASIRSNKLRPKTHKAWGRGLTKGHIPWNKGKPMSDYVKESLLKSLIGRRQSVQEIEKRRKSLTGRKRSDDQKRRISEARIKHAPDRPIICEDTDRTYRNVREAANALSIPPNSIHQALRTGFRSYGFKFKERISDATVE